MSRRPIPSPARAPSLVSCLAVAGPLLLAGLLPLKPEVSARWGWSGAWIYPVGAACSLSTDPAGGPRPYRVMRGVGDRDSGGAGHQGVDLSNGAAGGPVRAAANGLVVSVGAQGWNHGYGRHVVIAHRTEEGLVYTVYAHLAPGTVAVRAGQCVVAGRLLGRVGMTGRATSPHLHFEVRRAGEPDERWEHARVLDPLRFVTAHLATPRADTGWAQPYLAWAERGSLIGRGAEAYRSPTRAEWWRTLAATVRPPFPAIPAAPESLRGTLEGAGILTEAGDLDPAAPLEWGELARDLARVRTRGLCLPSSPVGAEARRRHCRKQFGVGSPGDDPGALADGLPGRPDRAAVCLVLADLAGDEPQHVVSHHRELLGRQRPQPAAPPKAAPRPGG